MKNPITNEIAYSILKIKLRIIVSIIYIFRTTIIYCIRKIFEKIKNILISAIKLFKFTLKLFAKKKPYKHLFRHIKCILKKLAFNRIILQIYNNKI